MSRFRINVHATYGPSPSALSLLRGDMPPVDTGEVCRRVAYSLTHERVYLDKGLSLAKLSSIVGTNTTPAKQKQGRFPFSGSGPAD